MGFRGVLLAAREGDVLVHSNAHAKANVKAEGDANAGSNGTEANANANANTSGNVNANTNGNADANTNGNANANGNTNSNANRNASAAPLTIFRVVCPDASLQLPTSGVPRDAPFVVEQKMVVTDFVTAELQQVTRLAGVQLQRETHSALWVAVVPATLQDGETAFGSTYAFDPQSLVRHVCYCFAFRSAPEFEIFERAYAASRHLQQYSLLEKSVHVEVAIQKELALNPKAKPKSSMPVPAGHEELKRVREQLRKDLLRNSIKEQQQRQAREICEKAAEMEAKRVRVAEAAAAAAAAAEAKRAKQKKVEARVAASSEEAEPKPPVVTPGPAAAQECILCGADSTCRGLAGKFVNHPYLLKDGRGNPVIVCKVCLQQVLKRRTQAKRPQDDEGPTSDDLCGLCTQPVAEIKGNSKACTHPQCPRVYCSPCLKKLFGKAQVKKVFRTKRWFCPNCDVPEDSADQAPEEEAATAEPEVGTKKRKRDQHNVKTENEAMIIDVNEVLKPPVGIETVVARDPTTGVTMTPMDYACTYYEFLAGREEQPTPPKESEDVCFACKDGGDVIECDWKKCPKVYHKECLGFQVPEDVDWYCPRHRCCACGFGAQYSCRVCVNSFCKNHFPEGIKELGPATAEISDVTYVLCTSCDHVATKALKLKKLSKEVYDRLLHPPSPRKQRASSSAKQKKRLR